MEQPVVSKKALLFFFDHLGPYLTPELEKTSLALRQEFEALPDPIPMVENLHLMLALDKLCLFALARMHLPSSRLVH